MSISGSGKNRGGSWEKDRCWGLRVVSSLARPGSRPDSAPTGHPGEQGRDVPSSPHLPPSEHACTRVWQSGHVHVQTVYTVCVRGLLLALGFKPGFALRPAYTRSPWVGRMAQLYATEDTWMKVTFPGCPADQSPAPMGSME